MSSFRAALMATVVVAGCGNDDDPGTPIREAGTIIIDQAPEVLAGAGWSLSGPRNETGAGDMTLTEMPLGAYTLTWDAVGGYGTPAGDTRTLVADGTITFRAIYAAGDFVLIPAGTFDMGSPVDEPGRFSDEALHTVTLTRSFRMLATEITNRQYADVAQWAYDTGHCTATGTSLSDATDGSTRELLDLDADVCEISFDGDVFTVDAGKDGHPVSGVTWYGAVAYCDWLSLSQGIPPAYDHVDWRCNDDDPYGAQGYRLPTEAEWERACRAGTQSPFHAGACLVAGTEANYDGSLPYSACPPGQDSVWTVPVGRYPANAYGLYDMHGNVYEWCNDWYGDYGGDETDPVGTVTDLRVVRGGSFRSIARTCRSAFRNGKYPDNVGTESVGFRPARPAD